jgi:GTPase KRas
MEKKEQKVFVLGEGGVGKSALSIRFTARVHCEEYDPTIEDCYRRELSIDNQPYAIEVVDLGSCEEVELAIERGILNCDGFLVVYSITCSRSLERARDFVQLIHKLRTGRCSPIVLVGNKCDLGQGSDRQVSFEQGQILAKDVACPFFETSAKDVINVDECFVQLAREVSRSSSSSSSVSSSSSGKKSCLIS